MRVLTTAQAGSPEWLAARRNKIGGTAAANIMLGGRFDIDDDDRPFGTPLSEWARLTGRSDDSGDSPLLEWGRRTETMHRAWLASLLEAEPEGSPGVVAHPRVDFIAVSPDGFVRTASERLPIEMKLAIFTARKWRDDAPPPLPARVQLAAVQSALDMESGIVSGLIPGQAPRWWRLDRHTDFEQYMLDTLGRFFEYYVQRDIPPPATGSDADSRVLRRMFSGSNGSTVTLPDALAADIARLVDVREVKRAAEDEENKLKNKLLLAIGEAAEGRAGSCRVTCSWQSRREHVVKASAPFPVLKAFKE